ncbi:MAG: serine/threonine-protein kinase [Myxococcales bacterium]|nr:serine/threonine-protein kinase [Myxococcales bacterium]
MANDAERANLIARTGSTSTTAPGPPPSVPPPDPLVGRTIDGRYHVESVLGEGGMGVVYKARHVVLGKSLALKVLRAEVGNDEEVMARFRQEAQSATAIGNEHIVDVSDFGTLPDGSTYFVMEFLDGVSLSSALAEGAPFAASRTIHIGRQLCRALGAAHERGIVHRDLKPDNVYLVRRGDDADFVKVLDFGIAKVGGGSKKLTRAGQVFGTPHYMSPEQCAGNAVDHRTDIYSLGVMLYEMVSGRVPFDADNLMGILTKHMYERPVPPHQLPPPVDCPPLLEAVILKCLAKPLEARYQSMAEVADDLARVAAGESPRALVEAVERESLTGLAARQVVQTGSWPTADRAAQRGAPTRRRRIAIAASVGAVAVVALLAVALSGQSGATGRTPPPPGRLEGSTARGARDVLPRPQVDEPESTPTSSTASVESSGSGNGVQHTGSTVSQTITVTSNPEGVEVWRDGELLGNTPIVLPRPVGEERVELVLRKADHREHVVRLSALTAESVRVTLARERRRGGRSVPGGAPSGSATSMATNAAQTGASSASMASTEQPVAAMRESRPASEVIDPWAGQ